MQTSTGKGGWCPYFLYLRLNIILILKLEHKIRIRLSQILRMN